MKNSRKVGSVTLVKDKYVRDDSTVAVKLRVSHKTFVRFIATGYYLHNGAKVNKHPEYNKILALQGRVADKLSSLDTRAMDIRTLMAHLKGVVPDHDLLSLIDEKAEKLSSNYRSMYATTKKHILDSGLSTSLHSIDLRWIMELEKYLRNVEMRPNTISINMRNVRSVYATAMKLGLVGAYPWRSYKMPSEPTRKRNLGIEDICKVRDAGSYASDIFMLSFYLLGINMIDLAHLQKPEQGRVYYIRSKGKKPYNVKLTAEALKLIEKHQGKSYLVNLLERYPDYRYATRNIDAALKKILPGVSMYYARYSWASIASSIGIEKDVIVYALHPFERDVTDLYINFDLKRVDEANKKVMATVASYSSAAAPAGS